jgi:hypothetical protein
MAARKESAAAPAAAPANAPQEPLYPGIEGFIEVATVEEVKGLYESIRADLKALKGPKADAGKKITKAIDRTEELLSYLLEVREKLQSGSKGGGKARR